MIAARSWGGSCQWQRSLCEFEAYCQCAGAQAGVALDGARGAGEWADGGERRAAVLRGRVLRGGGWIGKAECGGG